MFSKEKFPGLLALGIFTFMSTLDGSIVNIALPSMAREMHLEMSQVTWSVTIYWEKPKFSVLGVSYLH